MFTKGATYPHRRIQVPKNIWARLRTPRTVLLAESSSSDRRIEEPAHPSDPVEGELMDRLARARFPMSRKAHLVKALGGKGAVVRLKGWRPMVAEEVADLCFAERRRFSNIHEVHSALKRTSWPRAVTKALNMVRYPMGGPAAVSMLVGNVRIDGTPISELAISIEYPVPSTSVLLERLAEARSKASG
jgi:hypothetical protein